MAQACSRFSSLTILSCQLGNVPEARSQWPGPLACGYVVFVVDPLLLSILARLRFHATCYLSRAWQGRFVYAVGRCLHVVGQFISFETFNGIKIRHIPSWMVTTHGCFKAEADSPRGRSQPLQECCHWCAVGMQRPLVMTWHHCVHELCMHACMGAYGCACV